MNPILKYPGAKWRMTPWLMQYVPPHESYVEPFFGSGALFFNKDPSRLETINDLDGEVVNFFRVCRECPEELGEALNLTPWAREEFQHASLDCTVDRVERARRFAVRCWMAFGASASSTSWRHSTGNNKDGGPDNPKMWQRLPKIVYQVADRLKDAQIEHRPALDIIQRFNGSDVLLYVDPPYVRSTRTAHCNQYRYEMTDQDHEILLDALNKHHGMVMLSGYDCGLYQDLLQDWTMYRKRALAERGAVREECLWLNEAAQSTLPKTLWDFTVKG